jgi:hypothetical protein
MSIIGKKIKYLFFCVFEKLKDRRPWVLRRLRWDQKFLTDRDLKEFLEQGSDEKHQVMIFLR